jgi:hypothetical protein
MVDTLLLFFCKVFFDLDQNSLIFSPDHIGAMKKKHPEGEPVVKLYSLSTMKSGKSVGDLEMLLMRSARSFS